MRVSAVLKHKGHEVITIRPEATVNVAVHVLRNQRVGVLVVSVDQNNVDGMLSERDVVIGLADVGPAFLERPVAEVMTTDVVACVPDDSLERLMSVMTRRRVRHLPVIEHGRLVGLVSIGDVVERRLHELESEKQVLHEYITLGR
jgi:CBS domain-containing protein